ncbi:hypothetical protein ABT282_07795 [Streptomyces sp. NPDC000927]|uniref:hypothetical protein n=1 Tax=Streptomyces sp. NPDC000927 TaxID=3154371 RepID=UPI00332F74A7
MRTVDMKQKDFVRDFVRSKTLKAIGHSSESDRLHESERASRQTALNLTRFLGYEPYPQDGSFDLHTWVGRAIYEKMTRDLPKVDQGNDRALSVKGLPYVAPGGESGGESGEVLLELARSVIGMQSARDLQRMPGPSDLANQCDVCLADKIAQALGIDSGATQGHIYVKTWIGTAMHEKLEQSLPKVYDGANLEITVDIENISGLGLVSGHVDVHLPEVSSINDYKSADLLGSFGLKKMRQAGVKVAYVWQTMLYLYGLRRAGMPADWANLTFIPRDSRNSSEVWTATCAYMDHVAVFALERAKSLVDVVRFDRRHTLKPDKQTPCFTCVILPRLNKQVA